MNIVILGSGAMGCLFGGRLAEAGYPVTLVDVWKEHIDAINAHGLRIEGAGGDRTVRGLRAVADPAGAGIADLMIVFVKATMTKTAITQALPAVGPRTAVLTLQNGLGNVEAISEVVGGERVLAGVTGHGSTLLGPGAIRHAGQGDTVIGEVSGSVPGRLEETADVLRNAGFAVSLSDNVMGLIWGKLLVNVGINALTAVTGLRNGRLADFPETGDLMEMAIREAVAVAEKKGIVLTVSDPVNHTREIAKKTAANRSSMLQDVCRRRRTEISVINGAIVGEGKRLGVPTPVNDVLAKLVAVREKTYDESEFTIL
jgi:2-dehydropantoate 2-reductase